MQKVLVGNIQGPQGVKGDPGVSPTVSQTQIDDGWSVTITDATGPHTFTLTNGVSTTVSIATIESGHTVTITDKDGDHVFNVLDGATGPAGFSPTVAVGDIAGGHTVTITDASGAHPFNVMDGNDGADGSDGFSPTVTTTPVSGGTQVTITDAEGPHTFNVENGAGIPTGGTTGQYLRKTENGTEWSDIEAISEIDDSQPQSTTTTFSAKSISDMFEALEDNVTAGDTALETKINAKPSINDTTPSATTTYSGNKIDSLVNGIIDDNDTTATDSTWSAQKIQSQINLGDYNFYFFWTNDVQTVSGLDFTVEINTDSVTFQDGDIVIALPAYDNEPNKNRLLEIGGWIFKSAEVGTKTVTLTACKKAPSVGNWLSTRIFIIRKKGA